MQNTINNTNSDLIETVTEEDVREAQANYALGAKEGWRDMLRAEASHAKGRSYGKRKAAKVLRGGIPTGDAEFLAWAMQG